jgi:putative PIN family toxin of toxin-antitoxin system
MKAGESLRVVLDTNVLVAAAYAPNSASRRIVDACLQGELTAVVSPALLEEYDLILKQAVKARGYEAALDQLLREAAVVEPTVTPRVVPDDPADDKLVAAALAGNTGAIVTNDQHLLDLDPYGTLRIIRPADFVSGWLDHSQ